jgi:hypothetical protein
MNCRVIGWFVSKKFWEELIACFPFIRHGPHRRRCVQQFYCCVCIRCRGNFCTEPLPSNNRGIHIQTQRLMGGIYEAHRWDGLRCHDIHTKFRNDWFRHSKIDREWWSHKPTFLILKNQVGLWDHVAVRVCVCVSPPPPSLLVYIMRSSCCLCVSP